MSPGGAIEGEGGGGAMALACRRLQADGKSDAASSQAPPFPCSASWSLPAPQASGSSSGRAASRKFGNGWAAPVSRPRGSASPLAAQFVRGFSAASSWPLAVSPARPPGAEALRLLHGSPLSLPRWSARLSVVASPSKSSRRGNWRRFPVNKLSWRSCCVAFTWVHKTGSRELSGPKCPCSSGTKLPGWDGEKQGTGVCLHGRCKHGRRSQGPQ